MDGSLSVLETPGVEGSVAGPLQGHQAATHVEDEGGGEECDDQYGEADDVGELLVLLVLHGCEVEAGEPEEEDPGAEGDLEEARRAPVGRHLGGDRHAARISLGDPLFGCLSSFK